jgi:hypothetical protein
LSGANTASTFQIAPWHATAKPNCSFQVPGNLMKAMQGTTLSGLMSGSPAAAFAQPRMDLRLQYPAHHHLRLLRVEHLPQSLLNIVFFWLPFIKICIPFPSIRGPDEGMTTTYQDPTGWPFLPQAAGGRARLSRRWSRACAIPSGSSS